MTLFGVVSGFVLLLLAFILLPRMAFALSIGVILQYANIITNEPTFFGGASLICVIIGVCVGAYVDIQILKEYY